MSDAESVEDPPPPELVPPKFTESEALKKLDDHRCAICNRVLIHACRIDCGHTFCRYCLDVDRENRNERGKPTCFVCDAAVTEISQNTERDKEIDKLYATLSIDEQLARARVKAERKAEEDIFASRPKRDRSQGQGNSTSSNNQGQGSNESFGSGDASSYSEDADGASWRQHNEHYDGGFNNDGESNETYYCMGSYWPDEEEGNHEFRSSYEDEDDSNIEASFNGESSHFDHPPFHAPQPPIVIQHTVQHVFHTVEVRQDLNEGLSHHPFHRRDRNPLGWNTRTEETYAHPRYRDHPTCSPPMQFSNYNCQYRNQGQGPYYAPGPFYNPYCSTQPHTSGNTYTRYYSPPYYPSSEGYPHHRTIYTNASSSSSNRCSTLADEEDTLYQRSFGTDDDADGNEEEGRCSACESLCDFHRAMMEQEQRDEAENLRNRNSGTNLRQDYDADDNEGGDPENEYETGNLSEDHEIVTLNVRIPIPIPESRGRRMDSSERHLRPSSRCSREDILRN